jgi:magnesium chelatase family protein
MWYGLIDGKVYFETKAKSQNAANLRRDPRIVGMIEAGLTGMQALNARASGEALDRFAAPDQAGRALLMKAGETGGLSARGWTRTLRLARTIADLEGATGVLRRHIAEALIYRRNTVGAEADFDRRVAARSGLAEAAGRAAFIHD